MQRLTRPIAIAGLLAFSWPAMMLVHELGHVVGAVLTGGTVARVVWHPLAFSRTDVEPNPSPLFVVWAGPLIGVLIPMTLAGITVMLHLSAGYLFTSFAGFCLIANGAYIGIGAYDGVGDAGEMLRLGTPHWLMICFGMLSVTAGLWLGHAASPRLGFGKNPRDIRPSHAYAVLGAAILLWIVGLMWGNSLAD